MRLRNYFIVGAICALLLVAWVAAGACGLDKILESMSTQKMIIDTPAWGEVVFILPEGVPDITKIEGWKTYNIFSSVATLEVATDTGVYKIWVDENRPIPLGLSVDVDGEKKCWAYKTGRANYSGEPSIIDCMELKKFAIDRASQGREV